MTTYIKATVNVRHPQTLEVTTLTPGDILPEWAEGIVTNPAVIEVVSDEDIAALSAPASTPEPPADDDQTPPAAGDDTTPAGDPATPAGDDNPPAGDSNPPAGDDTGKRTRDELEARAKALNIRVKAEHSDAELQALIASKE